MDVAKSYDVISVGRLVPVKHNEIMIRAILRVKEKRPDIKACIVGDGPYKSALMQLADKLNIKANVDFVGFQKDTPYYYNSARIFVHTSEREGFPNVFLEAMMCGLPCVVSNCGDITDIARDGYNSLLIQDFYDVEGFARAITSLLENEKLYNEISQNALQTAKSLSADDIINRWELLFQKIHSHV